MFETLTSWENLLQAWRKASPGKRGKPGVAVFEHRLEDNLVALRSELRAHTYRPGVYTSFYIHEPKRRLISAALFRDRVVHHALVNVIEPVFERGFIHDSYANRVGKGTHRALDRCQQFARCFHFVLQVDLRQFFPSIDHSILRAIIATKVSDPEVLWLTDQILAGGVGVLNEEYKMVYFPGDDLFAIHRPRGLPIGNLTSQFWGNVILNPIDHFVKRELGLRGYVRYVDDLLLFGNDKARLWVAKEALVARLEQLRLSVHKGAHPRPVQEGIPFLGFVVYPDRRRLKRRKGVQFQRRLRTLLAEGPPEPVVESLTSWLNHVRYGNTVGLRKAILSTILATPQGLSRQGTLAHEGRGKNRLDPL